MARDSTTSMDVARLAGVSQSAVSRVFTPGASVSERTSQKVRDAARELGYRPAKMKVCAEAS
jgi:DNA-binding LacI/PurR family transcriptional regulator